ncbi:hypothetical protein [Winogradskyella sp. A2]|uniref:hypothetical protein n=1 Tax=Winogradskyella sp. A2 TaxID=3366944 RepID=UPI00398C4999
MIHHNFQFKEATDKERSLYLFLGEALCAVQILEDALSHSMVIKKKDPHQKEEAIELLKKQQRYTFGKGINIAKKESLLPKSLENKLLKILDERNWLIHESVIGDKENFKSNSYFKNIINRSKTLSDNAKALQISIELDLIEYCKNKGKDMSMVKNEMKKNLR